MGQLDSAIESRVRLSFFLRVLALMAVWEILAPRRTLSAHKGWRWTSNLGLVVLNTVVARIVLPMTAVAGAIFAAERGWGVLHLIDWSAWLEIALAVLVFDFAIYLQHVMFHAVPLFWRLHRVHHADLDFDVTTGVRFHTFEILLSALIKLAVVFVVGPSAIAVVLFEVLLNATSMFNHGNGRLPQWLDRLLRLVVVTPEMHRVHHSVLAHETNSNFGFNLPWWDYLMGTYRAQPEAGHEGMQIGIRELTNEREVDRLPGMLWMPFRGSDHTYPINRRRD